MDNCVRVIIEDKDTAGEHRLSANGVLNQGAYEAKKVYVIS